MRSVDGPTRVDVIYRRINEDFMDPDAFREDSVVRFGVDSIVESRPGGHRECAGRWSRRRRGYAFVPDMIVST